MSTSSPFSSFKIILVFVCLALVGLAFLPYLPVKLAPSQTLPQVNISFHMGGTSPVVIETEVTSKLEAMLCRMKGVSNIYSHSGNGWGNITIHLDKHINQDAARFEVSTIIRQAWPQLPQEVSYPSINLSRTDEEDHRPFLSYIIIAPEIPVFILNYVEEHIKPQLSQLAGIYQVSTGGADPMEWQLEYDYKQLENLHIGTHEIQTAISECLRNESLGMSTLQETLEEGKKQLRVALISDFDKVDAETLKTIRIKNRQGKVVRLGELVSIRRIESQPHGYYRINGMNSIYMSLTADKTANQLELANQVKQKLEELKENLPQGYNIQLTYDATEYIQKELQKIYFRSGLTIFILLLFVILVYRNFRYTLLICISLFVNLSLAFIFYYLLKLEIHLYSLAGITISLTLIIDNTIVMADQIVQRSNKKAFMAILAATATTVGSLIVIFFMDEKIRLNLLDFAIVLIINLVISLFIALFLVPALIEKLKISKRINRKKSVLAARFPRYHSKQPVVYFNRIYGKICKFLWRWRVAVIVLIVLSFGLPVFLLPETIKSESKGAALYNQTIGSPFYKEKIRPYVDMALGGTWRLFAQKVYNGSYWTHRGEETTLMVTATLPYGATLAQMNHLIGKMENYISLYPEVKQFETNVQNANRASISIRFADKHQKSSFPYVLKSKLISRSLELGGGSWGVHGLGDGFSNDIKEMAGSYRVEMFGFNYDELYVQAEQFRKKLLEHRRIKEVDINSEFSWYKDDYQEFRFELDMERLAQEGIEPHQLYAVIKPFFEKRIHAGQLVYEDNRENIILWSRQSAEYTIWDLKHVPLRINEKTFKLSELATIEKYQAPQKISKKDQQYRLCIQYEYIGAYEQGGKILKKLIEETTKELPTGYSIKSDNDHHWGWGQESNQQYWLLGLIFILIYFCSSILFNSFRQPLNILFIIPVSFIGVFLTFYIFKLNFDQGGFASFILLSGITVNANIYIINEYNNIRKRRPALTPQQAYLKAWNAKVRPIFLTVASTILGFVPFIIGYKEGFWFPLAAGTIGGLIVSFVAIFLLLPILMGIGKNTATS